MSRYEANWRKRRLDLRDECDGLVTEEAALNERLEEAALNERLNVVIGRLKRVRTDMDTADQALNPVEVFQHMVMEEIVQNISMKDLRQIIYLYAEDYDRVLRMQYENNILTCSTESVYSTTGPLSALPRQWTINVEPRVIVYDDRDSEPRNYRLAFYLVRHQKGEVLQLYWREERTDESLAFKCQVNHSESSFELIENGKSITGKTILPDLSDVRFAVKIARWPGNSISTSWS